MWLIYKGGVHSENAQQKMILEEIFSLFSNN